MIRRKRILRTRDDASVPVATFAFDGERLLAHYDDDLFRLECESGGISTGIRRVYPSDPAAFFAALDGLCARSSTLSIIAD